MLSGYGSIQFHTYDIDCQFIYISGGFGRFVAGVEARAEWSESGERGEKSSITMLGSALIAGASLVGGIMSTDIMDGLSMYVDIHGQTYKATHTHVDNGSVAVIILILSYVAWIVSMITFLCCLRVSGGANPELK